MILGIGGNYAGWNSDVLVLVFVGGELKEMKPIEIRSQLFNCNNKILEWNSRIETVQTATIASVMILGIGGNYAGWNSVFLIVVFYVETKGNETD